MNLEMVSPAPADEAADLAQARILVVGATGGIGRAVSHAVTRAGGQAVLLGRQVEQLESLADELEALGSEPLIYPMDLLGAGVDDYHALADSLSGANGALAGVVWCAWSGGTLRPFAQLDPERWARDTQVNLHAPTLLLRSLWPVLSAHGRARVLFSLDDLAIVTRANWAHHSVAQWAQAGLMRTLASEGRHQGIGVCGVHPGPRRTTLRARLFGGELPTEVPDAAPVGEGYVQLLAVANDAFPNGQVVDLQSLR